MISERAMQKYEPCKSTMPSCQFSVSILNCQCTVHCTLCTCHVHCTLFYCFCHSPQTLFIIIYSNLNFWLALKNISESVPIVSVNTVGHTTTKNLQQVKTGLIYLRGKTWNLITPSGRCKGPDTSCLVIRQMQ